MQDVGYFGSQTSNCTVDDEVQYDDFWKYASTEQQNFEYLTQQIISLNKDAAAFENI